MEHLRIGAVTMHLNGLQEISNIEGCPNQVRLSTAVQVKRPELLEVVDETSHGAPSTFSFLIAYPVENGAENKTTVAMGLFVPTVFDLLVSVRSGR